MLYYGHNASLINKLIIMFDVVNRIKQVGRFVCFLHSHSIASTTLYYNVQVFGLHDHIGVNGIYSILCSICLDNWIVVILKFNDVNGKVNDCTVGRLHCQVQLNWIIKHFRKLQCQFDCVNLIGRFETAMIGCCPI